MRILLIILLLLILAGMAAVAFVHLPRFGALPGGERLERIRRSPNFVDGRFVNRVPKPQLAEGKGMLGVTVDFFFRDQERKTPGEPVPSVKSDLADLGQEPALVWLGHSSYLIRADGKTILVDPALSGRASPFFFTTKAFPGTDPYAFADIPPVDILLVTHDHWDHLDYETMLALKDRIGVVVCGLGVGAHLERWGFAPERIIETDWDDTRNLGGGFTVHTLTAHHFGGRSLARDRSLWAAYVLDTPSSRIYIGGDSGYGGHFADAGRRFPGIDLAVLENGQYDANWPYVHMTPEESYQAGKDLGAAAMLPAHSAKFVLANHAWDEPLARIAALENRDGPRILTPLIGEIARFKDAGQTFGKWWEKVE